jgi:hypothetical protein
MKQVELEGPKLTVSALGFGCAGLMQSPSRTERMAALASAVDIVQERLERIGRRPRPHPRRSLPGQIGAHRLPVKPGVAGDRRDRPTTLAQGMYFHIVLPCEHENVGGG